MFNCTSLQSCRVGGVHAPLSLSHANFNTMVNEKLHRYCFIKSLRISLILRQLQALQIKSCSSSSASSNERGKRNAWQM